MKNLMIGQYVPGHSVVHRLDPRSKLVAVLFFVVIAFLANNRATYLFLIFFIFCIVFLSGIPIRYLYKGLRPVFWIVLLTFFLHVLMDNGSRLLFNWGWFHIYEEGVILGAYTALRIFFLVMMASILTLTTKPIDITDGLETLFRPLKHMRVPVHEFALMTSISLRFIPTLMDETDKIMKAQKARGTDFTSGSVKHRVKAIIPLLVPLFISAFQRAETLAIAMESRGYRGGDGRTKLRALSWKTGDTLLLIMLGLLIITMLFYRAY